jgi:S1-C subfamily serine protease
LSRRRSRVSLALPWLLAAAVLVAGGVRAAGKANPAGIEAEKFFAAIVKVQARALPDARSAATLGTEREGSGVLIGADGLIVTIGYLIIEADEVRIIDHDGRTLPASVVGYDHASGLALVRSVVPLDAPPLQLGDSARLAESEPVMVVSGGGSGDITLAYVVSRRLFAGNWEYLLERAIFTSPPSFDWSGAALIDRNGALVGIGSLILRDATGDDPHVPGNMFVPIDLLKPILPDLVRIGRRSGPARPWLGVNADEVQGRLLVARVSPGGPADQAGVHAGDIILAVGSEPVHTQAEFYRKVWGRGSAGSEIPLRVLQDSDVRELTLRSIDRVDYFRKKPMY